MNLSSRTSFLVYLAKFKPELWEIVHNGPPISEGTRNVMASAVIKSIAQKITNANTATDLHRVGKGLFEAGAKSMSYDDDFWPLHPKPWYRREITQLEPQTEPWFLSFSRDEVMLNPQPLPPHEQAYYGALLIMLADAVSLDSTAKVLRNTGSFLLDAPSNPYMRPELQLSISSERFEIESTDMIINGAGFTPGGLVEIGIMSLPGRDGYMHRTATAHNDGSFGMRERISWVDWDRNDVLGDIFINVRDDVSSDFTSRAIGASPFVVFEN